MFPVSCIDGAAKQNPQTELIVPHLGIRGDTGDLSVRWPVISPGFILLLRKMEEVVVSSPGAPDS